VFVVDTNVLLYAANVDAPEHGPCRARLETWRRQPTAWHLTWGIVYEFVRVSTHPRVFPRPWSLQEAWGFVRALLASPGLRVLIHGPRHAEIASGLASERPWLAGNLVFHAQTVALMREHGIRRIWTRDADFHRFPDLEVLDPLAPGGGG